MKFIADLHIHSPFSRATSKSSNLIGLASWASVKGVDVLGTGDFTHPGWFSLLKEQLEEAEPGFFKLRDKVSDLSEFIPDDLATAADIERIRFVLTAEISSIYKKNDRVRKNHNILFAPDFSSAQKINRALADIGNLKSDGRPILGLDARNLLEIVLEQAPGGFLVPAHIWTPWFSLFGSKSGFDRIEDCFEDLTPHVFALETGLSSDPEMNRHVSALDNYTLISNSDCHSPGKIGREANIFSTEFDFFHLREAIQYPADDKGNQVFEATVEFYPEEGKYHCDGHRKCKVCLEPYETKAHNGLCPQCNKPVTVGVLNRVMELADRDKPLYPENSPGVHSCIPLVEILSELLGVGPATKKVAAAYGKLITLFGSEFSILLDTPVDEISKQSNPLVGEAIERVRSNRVIRQPGYDGEFGVIRVFEEGERAKISGQMSMFAPVKRVQKKRKPIALQKEKKIVKLQKNNHQKAVLNTEQKASVEDNSPYIAVKAGPGTGKTHSLIHRVARIVKEQDPKCTIISFTNKAVNEVKKRIEEHIGVGSNVCGYTFHGYCLYWLRCKQAKLQVIGPDTRKYLLLELFPHISHKEIKLLTEQISTYYSQSTQLNNLKEMGRYLSAVQERQYIELEHIIPTAIDLFKNDLEFAQQVHSQTGHLFIDEFQDINRDQYNLTRELAKVLPVYIIGDPDQSIYGFRGAHAGWFQEFIDTFQASEHQLFRNYRSGQNIIIAAESTIANNRNRSQLEAMISYRSNEDKGRLYQSTFDTPVAEAYWIGERIEELIGGSSHREIDKLSSDLTTQYSLKNIAILVRTNRQMKEVALQLEKRGLPFQMVDLEAFYIRGDCRLIYLWILLIAELAGVDEFLFVINKQKGVDEKIIRAVYSYLSSGQGSIYDLLSSTTFPFTDELIEKELKEFSKLYQNFREIAHKDSSLYQLIDAVINFYSLDMEARVVSALKELSLSFATSLQDFAEYLKRYSDSVLYDEQAECLTLSTIHAAKGLEFDVVFIPGVNEGLLPLQPRGEMTPELIQEHIEEERRLFYVGLTRAVDVLHLSCVKRYKEYTGEFMEALPSQFLTEIPSYLFSHQTLTEKKRKTKSKNQLSLF